ncbi:protein of unknown function [Streptantibioticus cattleyicolor NRRL 8057 = DSM 46488]|nr:protein of unknown function [Streptantibioticus cattleyicolor NRRL 8057 = DSM 46488]
MPQRPALGHRLQQRQQFVAGEHQVGGVAGGGGAAGGDPHADVRGADRGGVVGAVADHGHHPPGGLEGLDDLEFLFRGDPGDHVAVAQQRGAAVAVEGGQPVAGGHGDVGRPAEGHGDRTGGLRVVAGEHHGAHARLPQRGDQRRGAGPRGVGQADEAEEFQVGQGFGEHVGGGAPAGRAPGHRDDAQPLPGQFLHDAFGVGRRPTAGGQDDFGGALDHQQGGGVAGAADRGGVTAARLEGLLGQRVPVGVGRGGGEHGLVGGVGVGAGVVGLARAGAGGRPQDGGGPGAGWRGGAVGGDHGDDVQPVLGEGAGLVEADGVHPAQRLQRARGPYQDAVPAQPAGGGHLRHGGHQRQPFGDGGHRDRHSPTHRVPYRTAAQQGEPGDHRAAGQGERHHLGRQPAQPHLDAGRGRGAGRQGRRPARLGLLPGAHHDGPGAAGHHGGALVDHAPAVGDGGPRGGRGVFGGGQRFAGERGLVHLQAVRLQQPAVGGDHVGGAQFDDVAGAQPGGVDGGGAGLAHPAGLAPLADRERRQRPLGAQPLDAADGGVDAEGTGHQEGVDGGAEQRGGGGAHGEHRGERVVEFGPYGAGQVGGDPYRGEDRQPGEGARGAGRLGADGGRAAGRPGGDGGDPVERLGGFQGVPVDAGARVRHRAGGDRQRGPPAGQQGGCRRGVDRAEPEAGRARGVVRASAAGDDQQFGQGGAGLREDPGVTADRAGRRHRRQQPPDALESVEREQVGVPEHGAVLVGDGHREVGAEQPVAQPVGLGVESGPAGGRMAGGGHPGDGEHHVSLAVQAGHDLVQRAFRAGHFVGEGAEVLQRRVVGDDDPQSGAAGGAEHGFGAGVEFAADEYGADVLAGRGGDHQAGGVLGRQRARVGHRAQVQRGAGAVRWRLAGWPQRGGGRLPQPVVVPAGHVGVDVEHGAPGAAQRLGVEHHGVHALQPPQPVGVADEHPVAGERGAQGRGEGGRAVAGGLGRSGQHRLGGLRHVPGEQQGGGGADDAAGDRLVGVGLAGERGQRRAGVAGGGRAGPVRYADGVVGGVEGGGAGHRRGELAAAQRRVEQQRGGSLPDAVGGGVDRGEGEVGAGRAEQAGQPGAYPGVLTRQRDQGGDQPWRAAQMGGAGGEGGGHAGRVAGEGGDRGAYVAYVAGVDGALLGAVLGLVELVVGGEPAGPVGHAVGDGVLGDLDDQPAQAAVPVGGEDVGVFGQERGDLPGPVLQSVGDLRAGPQRELEAFAGLPGAARPGQRLAGDPADPHGGRGGRGGAADRGAHPGAGQVHRGAHRGAGRGHHQPGGVHRRGERQVEPDDGQAREQPWKHVPPSGHPDAVGSAGPADGGSAVVFGAGFGGPGGLGGGLDGAGGAGRLVRVRGLVLGVRLHGLAGLRHGLGDVPGGGGLPGAGLGEPDHGGAGRGHRPLDHPDGAEHTGPGVGGDAPGARGDRGDLVQYAAERRGDRGGAGYVRHGRGHGAHRAGEGRRGRRPVLRGGGGGGARGVTVTHGGLRSRLGDGGAAAAVALSTLYAQIIGICHTARHADAPARPPPGDTGRRPHVLFATLRNQAISGVRWRAGRWGERH